MGIAVGAIVAGNWFVESDEIVVVGTCVDDNVGSVQELELLQQL